MWNSNQSGNLLVDEIDLQAQLLQSKIADIIQDEFAREMNRLVYVEARKIVKDVKSMIVVNYTTNA